MSKPEENLEDSSGTGPVALASYELIGKLARGGMGTVYVARRAAAAGFQRLFAIKLMHDHLADHDEFVQMFLDEARLAARLHHPNVVPIVDMGEVDGRQFVVMDYIEGCSLDQLLRLSPDNRPMACIVKIFVDFLMGLHAAHELRDDNGNPMNLVHRDVSPQNVLVGVDGVTRITDFGIAKAEARLTSTRPGLRKGKLAFMAPEQLYDQDIDRRADIFSTGALLWSALTGEKLFSGSSDAATMRNLLQLEILPPSEVGLKPPPFLDDACIKALQRDAGQRFQNAADMADTIRQLAIENGVFGSEADVSGWINRVAGDRLHERRMALGNAPSDGSVASMPVLVEAGSSTIGTVPVAEVSQIRNKRSRRLPWLLALLLIPLAIVGAVIAAVYTHDQNGSGASMGNPEFVQPGEDPVADDATESVPNASEGAGAEVVGAAGDAPSTESPTPQEPPAAEDLGAADEESDSSADSSETASARAPNPGQGPASRGWAPRYWPRRSRTAAATEEQSVAEAEPDPAPAPEDPSPEVEAPVADPPRPVRSTGRRGNDAFPAIESNPYVSGN